MADSPKFPSLSALASQRQAFCDIVPALTTAHASSDAGAFFRTLQRVLWYLGSHARQELDILVAEGVLGPEQITVNDLLNETLLRVWDGFPRWPGGLPLDVWLIRVLHDVFRDACQGLPRGASLNEQVLAPWGFTHEEGWWDRGTGDSVYPERTSLAELLPGQPWLDEWDKLDYDEKHVRMARLLGKLGSQQRHALLLSAVAGYEPEAIAAIQDRTADEVRADLDQARQTLRHELETGEIVRRAELDFDEPPARDTRPKRSR